MDSGNSEAQDIRQVRLRIARLRRRIDRRVRALEREGRRLACWRTYVRRYPAQCVLAALGLGAVLASGWRGTRWTRLVGWHVLRRAADAVLRLVGEELRRIWAEAAPRRPSEPAEEGTDGGA